ncbi:MAG: urease subunit beta [Janthinobacterium lividum]
MTAREGGVALTPLSGRMGQVLVGAEPVVTHRSDLPRGSVVVENTSEWPVVVTSHFHFFEANRKLSFDRGAAFGMHLDVLAGASARFDPGEVRAVLLVGYAGERSLHGFNGLTNTVLPDPSTDPEGFGTRRREALVRAHAAGFLDTTHPGESPTPSLP